MFGTLNSIPPSILWMSERKPVGHIVWPVLALSCVMSYQILDRAYAVYGDIPAVTHPIAFMISLCFLLFVPPMMAVGYYLLPGLLRLRREAPPKKENNAENATPKSGKFAFFCIVAALGFIPLFLFVGLLAAFDYAGIDVTKDATRHMIVGGLVAAALVTERWTRVGVDFMLGGLLLWGGIYVHVHLAKDSLSLWLLFESGIF